MSDSGLEAEGIDSSVRCSACEAVCCRLPVLLMPEDRIPARFIDHDDRGLEIVAKGKDGWCAALDRNNLRCTIYELRPTICRGFAMGGYDCREERIRWYGRAELRVVIGSEPVKRSLSTRPG